MITDTDVAYGLINHHVKDIHTNHQIDVYDVNADKTLSNGRLFTKVSPGFPDGIKVDEKGNVWSSSKSGVQVFNPEGKKIGEIIFPQIVSNLSFGFDPETKKPVLFVTSDHNIYRLTVNVAGAAAPK